LKVLLVNQSKVLSSALTVEVVVKTAKVKNVNHVMELAKCEQVKSPNKANQPTQKAPLVPLALLFASADLRR